MELTYTCAKSDTERPMTERSNPLNPLHESSENVASVEVLPVPIPIVNERNAAMKKTILAREAGKAVVFRRGPSSTLAV